MKKPKAKTIACHVNPSDYPVSRLEREHLALLKCINDTPIIRNNCIGEKPEPGKYYLAISSGVQNSFGVYLNEEPRYIACTLKEDNRTMESFPYEDFEVEEDPHGVMEKKTGLYWVLWNRLKWEEAKAALMDKKTFLYDDEFLIQNRFALVQYSDTSDTYGNLLPGRQYLAVTQEPDISPCVYIHILSGHPDEKARVSIYRSSQFDLLSDPLGLLNPWKTDWKKNIELQKQIHPGLYTKSA